MKTKVKVKRAELIRVVEGRVKKLEREHERSVASYPERVAARNVEVIRVLEKSLTAAKSGKLNPRFGRIELPDVPMKPNRASGELCNLRRVLATLKIGAEDTILMSQEDANVYFGPCRT